MYIKRHILHQPAPLSLDFSTLANVRIDSQRVFETLYRHEERRRAADIRYEHVYEGQAGPQR